MGFLAFVLLLAAEFGLVLQIRGLSIAEYVAGRDPVSGTVYYMMLGVFAVMPLAGGAAMKFSLLLRDLGAAGCSAREGTGQARTAFRMRSKMSCDLRCPYPVL
jgi:hypothetical protein